MIVSEPTWSQLEHAYGPATDVPEMLYALLSEDPELAGEALAHLDAAVLHQGTLYSATAPAALGVAALLTDTRTAIVCRSALPWRARREPLRALLLGWLADVARSAADRDEGEDADEARYVDVEAVNALRAIRADILAAVAPLAADPDAVVRAAARGTLTALFLAPELADHRSDLMQQLITAGRYAAPAERADIAIAIGVWGRVPWDLLADAHPGVRACAALAPALDHDPAALDVVKVALRDPTVDAWFDEDLPQLGRPIRYALVDALLRRTETFEQIATEACAVALIACGDSVADDWGPLLHRAFERRYRPGRMVLTEQQRRYLLVIADNDACWTMAGYPMMWLERAGLPINRSALRTLAQT